MGNPIALSELRSHSSKLMQTVFEAQSQSLWKFREMNEKQSAAYLAEYLAAYLVKWLAE
jgi:hypothetical protein